MPSSLFFEDDDTGADLYADSLKNFLEDAFRITVTKEKIAKDDRMPAFTMRVCVNEILRQIGAPRERPLSLLILAYIGHGIVDPASRLLKLESASGKQSMLWKFLDDAYFCDDYIVMNVDTLVILNCSLQQLPRQSTPACHRFSLPMDLPRWLSLKAWVLLLPHSV